MTKCGECQGPHISIRHTILIHVKLTSKICSFQGRWNKADLRKYITFKTAVRNVTYNKDSDNFSVVIEDFDKKTLLPTQTFDYVIVAIGHYSVPFTPYYPGVERFPGRVMHSHDFRDACEFAGKRLLVVRFLSAGAQPRFYISPFFQSLFQNLFL